MLYAGEGQQPLHIWHTASCVTKNGARFSFDAGFSVPIEIMRGFICPLKSVHLTPRLTITRCASPGKARAFFPEIVEFQSLSRQVSNSRKVMRCYEFYDQIRELMMLTGVCARTSIFSRQWNSLEVGKLGAFGERFWEFWRSFHGLSITEHRQNLSFSIASKMQQVAHRVGRSSQATPAAVDNFERHATNRSLWGNLD